MNIFDLIEKQIIVEDSRHIDDEQLHVAFKVEDGFTLRMDNDVHANIYKLQLIYEYQDDEQPECVEMYTQSTTYVNEFCDDLSIRIYKEMFYEDVETLESEVYEGRQSVNFKELLKIGDTMLRIHIKRDSYDFQSTAVIQIHDGHNWSAVEYIPYINMTTNKTISGYSKEAKSFHFGADRDELIKLARTVLEI